MNEVFLIFFVNAAIIFYLVCGEENVIKQPETCKQDECEYFLQWHATSETQIDFYLGAKTTHSISWVAVGFADKPGMPDSGAVECISAPNEFIIQASYNKKYKNYPLENAQLGLIAGSSSGEQKLDRISCNFSHVVEVKESDPEAWKVKPLNRPLYILIAHGPASPSGKKKKHGKHPYISKRKIDFLNSNSSHVWNRSPFVVAHGSIMTIVWMLLLSFTTAMSRYLKDDRPQRLLFCRKPLWFQVHRICAISALCLIIISILIVLSFMEWTFFTSSHSVLGAVLASMVALNVALGIFRPRIGKPARKYFLLFHGLNGHLLHLIGFIAMYLGLRHERSFLPLWVSWIPIGFLLFRVFIDVILMRLKYPSLYRYNELVESNWSGDEHWSWRYAVVVSYFAVAFGAALCTIVAIVYSPACFH